MLKSLVNATLHTWMIERFLQFIIGPIIKITKNVDYDTTVWAQTFRKHYAALFGRNIFHSCFVKVIVQQEEDITEHLPIVWGYTHASNFDPFMLVGYLPHRAYFIAKASLKKIPFFGYACGALGMIAVDRKNITQAKSALWGAEDLIRDRGYNIAIAPEGTRRRKASDANDHSLNLAPFKKGPFHTVKNAGCAFVPVCLFGVNRIAPPGSMIFKQGTVVIKILKAIPREVIQEKSVEELVDYTREIMMKSMNESNDYVTNELLGVKEYNWTMILMFTICWIQMIVEPMFMWWIYKWISGKFW